MVGRVTTGLNVYGKGVVKGNSRRGVEGWWVAGSNRAGKKKKERKKEKRGRSQRHVVMGNQLT